MLSSSLIYRLVFCFLCLPLVFSAQYSIKDIDYLMTAKNAQLRSEHKFEEIVSISKKVIENSKAIQYKKGEIYGYTRLGNALCNLRRYKESLVALNLANQLSEHYNQGDNLIRASIHLGLGRCYLESRASYQNAIVQFEMARNFADKITDESEKKEQLILIYSNFYAVNMQLENFHKAAYFLRKSLILDEANVYSLAGLAWYHNFTTGKSDSARYYLDKAENIKTEVFEKTLLYNQWGKYYYNKGDYDKAISNYKTAERLANDMKQPVLLDFAITELYNTFEKKGDKEKAFKYSKKRMNFKDSLNLLQTKNSEITIEDLVQKKDKNIEIEKSKTNRNLLVIGTISVLILSIFGYKIYTNRKEKDKVLKLIEEQEEANKELKLKVNDAFDEVVQLAKDNNPEFLTRFQEVYPDYYRDLLSIEPKLLATELKLCAMIYLGFSSKDIAEYTFVTLKAAQHRKFRLRKKLNIPSDVDINVWLKDFMQTN